MENEQDTLSRPEQYIIFLPLNWKEFYLKSVTVQADSLRTLTFTPIREHAKRFDSFEAAEATARLTREKAFVIPAEKRPLFLKHVTEERNGV